MRFDLSELTATEFVVLQLAADGLSAREIAHEQLTSVKTAAFHLHNLRQKFGVNKMTKVLAIARRSGLIDNDLRS